MHRSCPQCEDMHANHPINRHSYLGWLIKQCSHCGFIYLENPPHYEALEEDFAWEKTSVKEESRRKKARPISKAISHVLKRARHHLIKRDKIGQLVKRYMPNGNVLDIGCGTGGCLINLPNSCTPYGVEISAALAETGNMRLRPRGGYVVQANAIDGLKKFKPNFMNWRWK